MRLKDYQTFVLEKLTNYLKVLKDYYENEKLDIESARARGTQRTFRHYCREAWEKLQKSEQIPVFKNQKGQIQAPHYLEKKDGRGELIPNICLKVPTGGGKTLLGVCGVEQINCNYFLQTTGLVMWVVPSEAIYQQTLKNFKNRGHVYRKILERASGGRVKILEKTDAFSKQDLKEYLCVMLIMLQSTNRETKESLRVFKDSGKFIDFFPQSTDYQTHQKLLEAHCNLDVYDDQVKLGGFQRVCVKQSLGNAIRLARPIVVLDEGHKAYSTLARKTITGLNPKFILELSATPNMDEMQSNILVNVSGVRLKEENMIKLPINIVNSDKADWKKVLCQAYEKLESLQKDADQFKNFSKKYIRPIMLIQVERTGKEQRDRKFIHSEDVKEYLVQHLGIQPSAVRIKTSGKNELKDEDLLSSMSQVRFIITHKALQEGWDCPFAYVLAILSQTKSKMALTQLIGRILRQPYAKATSLPSLNESYVFCYNNEVQEVISGIKKGLQQEGMGDVADHIQTNTDDKIFNKVRVERRSPFKYTKIFLPKVLQKEQSSRGCSWRGLIYENDILRYMNFAKLSYSQKDQFTPDDMDQLRSSLIRLDIRSQPEADFIHTLKHQKQGSIEMDFPYMVRRLTNVVPNPWQASRILKETFASLKAHKISDRQIYLNRHNLLESIERDLQKQIYAQSEHLFKEKLAKGDICFQIFKDSMDLNWDMPRQIDFLVAEGDRVLHKRDDRNLQLTLFESTYTKHYNHLEKRIAWYLDEQEAVKWWHRLVARQDYYIQDWQKRKVYPDFLAFIDHRKSEIKKLSILETKGEHLKGNEDTKYKEKLFHLLENYANHPVSFGTLETASLNETKMVFKILMEDSWQKDIQDI